MIHRYNLVLHHSEIPTRHWRNQLLGWLFPTLSCIFLLVLQCLDYDAIGDCNRVWYALRPLITYRPWISNNLPEGVLLPAGSLLHSDSADPPHEHCRFSVSISCVDPLHLHQPQIEGRGPALLHSLRSFAYLLVAVFCVVWSAWDRTFLFLRKKEWPFPFDVVSLSVPLLVALGRGREA